MKTFLYKHRGRLICTVLSLVFVAWHNLAPAEASSHKQGAFHAK